MGWKSFIALGAIVLLLLASPAAAEPQAMLSHSSLDELENHVGMLGLLGLIGLFGLKRRGERRG